ncbi:ferritin-like domain-containing protein [Luedemannella flava]
MRDEVFSLADECKVRTYPRLIWQMGDPRNSTKTYYMPPTRDLTLPKSALLLRFLRAQQAVADVPELVGAPRRGPGRIERRGQLWSALKVAATVELAATLQYLFAAYSVPAFGAAGEYVRRGLWTPEQRWLACGDGGETTAAGVRGALLNIAREEMIHFLMVNNIIMAMGEPFHVPAVDFGTLNATLPLPLDFALEPVHLGSLHRFIALEQPERDIGEVRGATPDPRAGYRSPAALYAEIRDGIERVPDLFMVRKGRGGGEHHLFLRESINAVHPDFQLEVDDVPSALFAVDVITEQGEGGKLASAPSPGGSHFETLLRVSDELIATRAPGRPAWSPAYPVARNPSAHDDRPNRTAVTEPTARAMMALFNRSYYLMLQLMVQHFGAQPDASLRRSKIMNAAIDVMTGMMGPLAEVLVTLPRGSAG